MALQLSLGVHNLYLGTIGASRQNDQASVRFDNVSLAAAVPEPSSMLLVLAGAAGLALMRRRARG